MPAPPYQRKRYSPSGRRFDDATEALLKHWYIPELVYPDFEFEAPGQLTVETKRTIYALPPFPIGPDPLRRFSVIANPSNYDDEEGPAWLGDFSLSHVRIGASNIDAHAVDPLIPAGTLAVDVWIGLSSLKVLAQPATVSGAVFDLMFLWQEALLSAFPIPAPPPGPG